MIEAPMTQKEKGKKRKEREKVGKACV